MTSEVDSLKDNIKELKEKHATKITEDLQDFDKRLKEQQENHLHATQQTIQGWETKYLCLNEKLTNQIHDNSLIHQAEVNLLQTKCNQLQQTICEGALQMSKMTEKIEVSD